MERGRFLNVDLDIGSPHDLQSLAAELGASSLLLHSAPACSERDGPSVIRLESLTHDRNDGPDAVIHGLCRVIEALSPAGRALWYSATIREFDIGIDAQPGFPSARFVLRPDTIGRVARLGATLAVTVYPVVPGAPHGARLTSSTTAPVLPKSGPLAQACP